MSRSSSPRRKRRHHLEFTKVDISPLAVALSSTPLRSGAAQEACWLRNLYSELGLLQDEPPTLIRGDNGGSIAMAKNPQFHENRSKHIAIRWHWVHKLVQLE